MSILRQCVFPIKRLGHSVEVSGLLLCGIKHDTERYLRRNNVCGCYPALSGAKMVCLREESYHTSPVIGKFFMGSRHLSSLVNEKSCNENILKETVLELEKFLSAKVNGDINLDEEVEQEFESEPSRLDDPLSEYANDLYLGCREPLKRKTSLELLRTVMNSPAPYLPGILKKFAEAVEHLSHLEASKIVFILWKHHMYYKALKILEWLETTKQLEHSENAYASHLDLIAKVQGVDVAEKYMKNDVPDSFKGELLYRTLLVNCVRSGNMEKSVTVFEKMRSLGLPITIYTLNQMIILYKKYDRRKILGILSFMKNENLTPSHLTYRILIATKGETGDIIGMEQLVEDMKSHGLQPDTHFLTDLARYYISEGYKHKAITILKEIEGANSHEYIRIYNKLFSLYASLDMTSDVSRIWNNCKSDPTMLECEAVIGALGKLGKVEEAEAVFEMAMHKFKGPSSRLFSELLRVYALNDQISKGKDFVERMRHSRCWSGPLVWDGLVRFYVKAGDVEKAASILSKAAERQCGGAVKPLFSSYMVVMEQYANCGDVHNTEKWFYKMRQCGYTGRLRPFQILVQAYLKAKIPAYGVRERMKAENVFPNKEFSMQLTEIDALKNVYLIDP
ncbi:pentatricopeptide repeat-containing protein At1g80270, mitochondrial-like isoform X2 [Vigna unguiculata]|uniref:pentatricopeptide repeat-containing protein At1g80270, mitochondrial-like isoform X2 n=1 Tax=Vigna unguiculata TaxID=3917 RepID=UPI0010164F59|nr:pentatricopeptide repeat-containing protein At1g80270, mitochondrial-like isoform X2 [Vigna unguiculata]